MDMLNFDEKLFTYNHQVDREHRKIVSFYNQLVFLLDQEYSPEHFVDILDEMSGYAHTHFRNEELYMESIAYPEIEMHKQLHKDYMRQVSLFNAKYLLPEGTDPNAVLDFLGKWWKNHILEYDMAYIEFGKRV